MNDLRGRGFRTVEWSDEGVVMLDQRLLPGREVYLTLRTPEEVASAIKDMVIRGAPAIGVAAAMGVALAAVRARALAPEAFRARLEEACGLLGSTRPTAVNLFWAIEKMRAVAASLQNRTPPDIAASLVHEALVLRKEDEEACRRMGRLGAELLPASGTVLTHCNAGALATAGYGTALGVIRAAVEAGKSITVLADETRPFLQGARLTAWELAKDGIPVRVITDNMAGHFLSRGEVAAVVVGADRIAGNGDTANKIGTYSVAVLARENNVPFYVAAPLSTIDLSLPSGDRIPIEQRSEKEVTHIGDHAIAPQGVPAAHPAFDVTPHRYIAAIVTEAGVARPPYGESLKGLFGRA
ncbi:MAG TPA: S-methyl-5-thioribose-1-phosphate isomerase [Candidatus Polarisedimenticolia bacterium]|nr:S-methyl-5-thioribose-1-phosphate isomerase [Candidatus Polarisedimenticolia bacterium]